MNDRDLWNRAYMELGRTPAEPEPAERRRQDRAIYLIAVITLAVLAAVI